MIKLIRTDNDIKNGLEDILIENDLKPQNYDLEAMIKSFSQYVEEDFSQYMLDKYCAFYDNGYIDDFEKEV